MSNKAPKPKRIDHPGSQAEITLSLDSMMNDLSVIERAIFGILAGAATALQADVIGADVDALLRDVRVIEPKATRMDIFGALDTLQATQVEAEMEGGGIMAIVPVAVMATITDRKKQVQSMTIAVAIRGLTEAPAT